MEGFWTGGEPSRDTCALCGLAASSTGTQYLADCPSPAVVGAEDGCRVLQETLQVGSSQRPQPLYTT